MAGRSSDFNAKEFRAGIRFAFNMAAPPVAADQATFLFESVLVYNGPVDDNDVPFDPAATVTRTTPPSVKVTCGIEYFDRDGNAIVFGDIVPSRVEITLLDEEFALVKNAIAVVIGGERFKYDHTEPPSGLFDVGLAKIHYKSENDL